MMENCLVKLSGDMIPLNPSLLGWVDTLSKEYHLVILVGGGVQINHEFVTRGIPLKEHGPLGRELSSFKERQIARNVLEDNQKKVQDELSAAGIHCTVEIPVIYVGTVLCHVNGDQYILSA